MIKFIAAALWICAVTVGAVLYSFQTAAERKDEAPQPLFGGLDYISTNIISVPLVRDSAVKGYFLTKLVYTVDPSQMAKLSVPANALVADEVYTYLYANPQIDPGRNVQPDLNQFRAAVRDAINARLGITFVHEVLVEQMNFLSQDEVRDNAIRRRKDSAAAAAEAASPQME